MNAPPAARAIGPATWPVPALGVHLVGDGADVAVHAAHATGVDLCLIDVEEDGTLSEQRIALLGPAYGVWHAHVQGIEAGQRYGFRAHGPWMPQTGLRHNPAKLLVDPYARGLVGDFEQAGSVFGHVADADGQGDRRGPMDERDSLGQVPLGVVLAPVRHSDPPSHPFVPWDRTLIYEAHVRGLTKKLTAIPAELRGTYAALGHRATIDHLVSLGITTLELLPIHAFLSEPHLRRHGLANYWGYNTLGFFAPHAPYATAAAQSEGPAAVLAEIRAAVRALHAAGIEVVLDVVYNHTCEGGTDQFHLSWRGLDHAGYYLREPGSPARLADVTGCGNSLDFRRPHVIAMAMDSLRYWVQEVGIDGFRFDLAVTLGRDGDGFNRNHPFLVALQTDPVLAGIKLIAEPWDVGPGGWQTGQFPAPMAEWNDRFRGSVRSFWLSDPAQAAHGRPGHGVRDLATRLAGSVDLFGHGDPPLARGPNASVNFVTAHDGFTLRDLVTYEHKHNEANGEEDRDGTDDNRSWNHGVEGEAVPGYVGDEIVPLRRRSMRNLLGTLLLSAGTPMLTAGDELGRTQRGNNNAYCQDNEISWLDWDLEDCQRDLLATTTFLLKLRATHSVLRPTDFYRGNPLGEGADAPIDLLWFGTDGTRLDHDRWHDPRVRTLQMLRSAPVDHDGASAVLVVINGALNPVDVTLAPVRSDGWDLVWDSVWEHPDEASTTLINGALRSSPGDVVVLEALAMRVYTAR